MVKIDECICRPKALAEFFTGNDFPRRFQKHGQEQERLFLQPYFAAVSAQLSGAKIHFEIGKSYQ
jgi:hypothetical protein